MGVDLDSALATLRASRERLDAAREASPSLMQLRIVGGSDPASEAIVHETLAGHAREHKEQDRMRAMRSRQNPGMS